MAQTFLARVRNPTWPIQSGREGMPIAEANIPRYMATSPMFGEQLVVTFTLDLTGDTNGLSEVEARIPAWYAASSEPKGPSFYLKSKSGRGKTSYWNCLPACSSAPLATASMVAVLSTAQTPR